MGGYAGALRREIIARSERRVQAVFLLVVLSYGKRAVVVYDDSKDGTRHGNFYAQSHAAILQEPSWRKRLSKPHTGRRNLPKLEKWCELDSCTSSDALLMNIFCNPQALAEGRLQRLMTVDASARPEFGVRVAAPLKNGHRDRTDGDMRLGDVLVEA